MGCHVTKCKLCKKEIKGNNYLSLLVNQDEHLKIYHKKEREQNKKAELQYKEDCKKALDKKLKNSINRIFTEDKWDGADFED